MSKFPKYIQLYNKDCGPACLKIISKYYNKFIPINELHKICETTRLGTSFENLTLGAESIGFKSLAVKISTEELKQAPLPCILHWENNHYVVLHKINKYYHISDPAIGLIKLNEKEFLEKWIDKNAALNTKEGVCLLLEVSPKFYSKNFKNEDSKINLKFFKNYFKNQKRLIVQLILGLIIGLTVQLSLPFITQNIVDYGIINKDIEFIYILLIAQVVLFLSYIVVDVIRNWILLYLGNRIKIFFISDFIIKLMSLPVSFFDTKKTGDILQRIEDHLRIKKLLTTTSLSFIFSVFTLIVFSIVLLIYSLKLFIIFIIGSVIYFGWFILFLKKRAILDNETFKLNGIDRSNIIEIINGMQEIKLNNSEVKKRWKWEEIQVKIFKNEHKSLKINLFQNNGTDLINEFKNIILTFVAALLVINGEITLGMMLAIMYIIAQLNNPLISILSFIQQFQDAYLSILRLSEIKELESENDLNKQNVDQIDNNNELTITNVDFKYPGANDYTLKGINFIINKNKTTAIVGKSGSGKTTLLKLLLNIYPPTNGEVKVNKTPLERITLKSWRNHCGVVMQEGYIFSDTLINNICIGDSEYDTRRFDEALRIANLEEFVKNLPLKENTFIGSEGIGISTGEKQRILIARAVYKDPKILFFDEATSSLDTENEKIIVNNLESQQNKTTLVIAHRLSTVQKADQIIVLEKGKIIESGNHKELIKLKGSYYKLIKNQLELGN